MIPMLKQKKIETLLLFIGSSLKQFYIVNCINFICEGVGI